MYSRYDLVVGHRVHGIGIAASQGIPGICVVHDLRGETARGFGAQLLQAGTPIDEALRLFDAVGTRHAALSGDIVEHKRQVEAIYTSLLQKSLLGGVSG
ncbi:hypothetical protein [Solimonas marina]|uniref:hypothetical protein n=1 Tax=Solimonas marina TaxID=2714601 RepID=UPI00344E64F5